MRRVFNVCLLWAGLLLAVGSSGCDNEPNPPPSGNQDAGEGQPDGGGCDGGVLADGGCQQPVPVAPKAHVRFVNAFLGMKDKDSSDAPWAPYKIDIYLGETQLFSSVEPGTQAVTDYREIEITPGARLQFIARNADSAAAVSDIATSTEISLEEGEHLTLVGVGFPQYVGQDRLEKPRLLALEEAFPSVEPGNVRLRFVTADRVSSTGIVERWLTTQVGSTPLVSLDTAYSADSAEGVSLPVNTGRLWVGGTPTFAPAQSGTLSFSLPRQALVEGTSYFVITTGDDARLLRDEGSSSLLLVPAGKNGALRVKRDPLVAFFHALLPAAPATEPVPLAVFHGQAVIANNIEYGTEPKMAQLPVSTAGEMLRFSPQGRDGQTVLADVRTEPLEAGSRYLAVLSGREGENPRLTVVQDGFSQEPTTTPRVRFIQASPNAPANVDFGFFTLGGSGTSRDVFESVIDGVAYPAATGPATGTLYGAPSYTHPVTGLDYFYAGVRTTVDGTATVRWARGYKLMAPNFIVLMGDWSVPQSLTYRAVNVQNVGWAVSGPANNFFSDP